MLKAASSAIFPALYVFFLFCSCSQHNNTRASKTFHNTTSRYNAYFLSREKMKEVEYDINESAVDDYNNVIPVFPSIAKATQSTIKPKLEEIIKKAALINEKHKNSKWLDDSFVIIGKSEMYKGEFKNAIDFFKYVNTVSKDDLARVLGNYISFYKRRIT